MKITNIPAVTETRVVEITPAKVHLELSPEEAHFLVAVLGRVAYSLDESWLYSGLYNQIIKGNANAVAAVNKLNNTLTGTISLRQ